MTLQSYFLNLIESGRQAVCVSATIRLCHFIDHSLSSHLSHTWRPHLLQIWHKPYLSLSGLVAIFTHYSGIRRNGISCCQQRSPSDGRHICRQMYPRNNPHCIHAMRNPHSVSVQLYARKTHIVCRQTYWKKTPGATEDLDRTIYLLQYPLQWSDTCTRKNTQSFEIQVGVG